MDIVDRLVLYRDYIGFSNSQFADKAGIPRPTLSQFLNGRNKRLSDDLASKIHQAYPDLNIIWLLFGEGDMVTAANIEFSEGKTAENSAFLRADTVENKGINTQNLGQNSFEFSEPILTETQKSVTESSKGQISDTSSQNLVSATHPATVNLCAEKKIQRIMVFYSDNSYEIFTPSSDK